MSMHKTIVVLALTLVTLSTVGCGAVSVRHVRRGAYSGEVAVSGPVVESTSQAYVVMSEHCRGPFHIVEESEGMALAIRDAASGKADGVLVADVSGTRLHYVCARSEAH